jgi:hypothetical protein
MEVEDKESWILAMDALRKNDTWDLVSLLDG